MSPTERARGLLATLAGRRGQGPPPSIGRGLDVPQLRRRRGLQLPSPPHVGRGRARARSVLQQLVERKPCSKPLSPNILQSRRGRGLRPPPPPHLRGRARARALLQEMTENNTPSPGRARSRTPGPYQFPRIPCASLITFPDAISPMVIFLVPPGTIT